MNKKGFTLIELLAVIIILGVLMIIAIPAVTNYISESRKESYVDTAKQMINGARNLVNSGKLKVYDENIAYYIPSSCIPTETGGKSPYGEFKLAYVIVTYNGNGFDYYWESTDETGTGIVKPVCGNKLDKDYIETSLKVSDIKTNYSIGGRTKSRIYNNNCTSYTDVDNTLELGNQLKSLVESDSSIIIDDYGNLRYIGRDNVNNYLRFEDNNRNWRILGIVDGYVKVIDATVNVTTVNNMTSWWVGYGSYDLNIMSSWGTSRAMRELNNDYYNVLSDLTKKSIIEFTFGVDNSHMVDDKKNVYRREREAASSSDSSKKWTGKVASIYASDFLYSNSTPASYNTSWVSDGYWRFYRNSGAVGRAFLPLNGGWIGTAAPNDYVALPTVYLRPGLIIKSGNGTTNNPYIVKLDEYVPCDD